MSVLTILGNGLDLAHGLKTKFDDFTTPSLRGRGKKG